MLPGDAAIKILSDVTHIEYGKVKPFFDGALVLIAAVISLLYFGYLDGVTEGTIAAAIIVGPIMKLYPDKFGYRIDHYMKKYDN